MWKRDEAVRPTTSSSPPSSVGLPPSRLVIGKSVVIKGELNGNEDLTIEGQVEGTIRLHDHVLTIGANGRIKAHVFAKAVIVLGEVTGNVTATDKVDIRDNGSLDGEIVSPRVAIAENAHFRGSVDMLPRLRRMLVEVSVPDSDAEAPTHLARLRSAVTDLLETFGFEPDKESNVREVAVPANYPQRAASLEARV
jgi:cytoskeletal protein CcmA (bactofilin family)